MTTQPHPSSPDDQFIRIFKGYFSLGSLVAAICLIWLISIPSDSKNAVIANLSISRLALSGLLFAIGAACAAIRIKTNQILNSSVRSFRHQLSTGHTLWKLILIASSAVSLLGLPILIMPAITFGDLKWIVIRLKPLIAWFTFFGLQTLLIQSTQFVISKRAILSEIRTRSHNIKPDIPHWKSTIPLFITGALIGGFLSFFLKTAIQTIFEQIPWLPFLAILFGFLLIFFAVYRNAPCTQISAAMMILLFSIVIITNFTGYRANTRDNSNARLNLLPGNDAITLGQEYHYSLSLYHILSRLYPTGELVTTREILREWELQESRLIHWAFLSKIRYTNFEPILSTQEVKKIHILDTTRVEINTLTGTYTYFFIRTTSAEPLMIVTASYDRERYFIPMEQFLDLFPDREIIP